MILKYISKGLANQVTRELYYALLTSEDTTTDVVLSSAAELYANPSSQIFQKATEALSKKVAMNIYSDKRFLDKVIENLEKKKFMDTGSRLESYKERIFFQPESKFHYKLPIPVYKDQNFSGFSAGAAANVPDAIAWDGGTIYVRGFDGGATTQQLFAGAELQHDYSEGTDLVFHVHWSPTTADAGDVKWQITYTIEREGTGTIASDTISVVDSAGGTAWLPTRANFTAVSGTSLKIEDQIQLRLFRDPTDGDDTYGADAALAFTFGYHYQVNTVGSRLIGEK